MNLYCCLFQVNHENLNGNSPEIYGMVLCFKVSPQKYLPFEGIYMEQ